MKEILTAVVGLVMLAVGIRIFGGALKAMPAAAWMQALNNPYLMFVMVTGITLLVQSSSITSAAIVAFVASGKLGLVGAIGGILGANVGTTGTAHIAALFGSGYTGAARQVAWVHTGINLTMALATLPFARIIAGLVGRL